MWRKPATPPSGLLWSPLLLCLPLLMGFGPPPTLVESDGVRMPLGRADLARIAAARPPAGSSHAALIMDMTSGSIPFSRNAHQRLAPASLTKVMTALIVIERGGLDHRVTITQEDMVEGSTMGLEPGQTVTVEHLLWGLLVPSGNDAAHALARTYGEGSVPRFVEAMNARAGTLRLRDTRFANPHGLDAEGHYSSAYDMALLSRHAMRYPLFARIVASKDHTIDAGRSFYIRSTNQLLSLHALSHGITGIKTGFTDKAGDCLIASVDRDGRRIIAVVMGAPDGAASAAALIDYAYAHFTWMPLPAVLRSHLAEALRVAPAVDPSLMVPVWESPYVSVRVTAAAGPELLPFQKPAGLLAFDVGGREHARMPLYPAQPGPAALAALPRVEQQPGR